MAGTRKIWVITFEFVPYPGGQATFSYEIARAFAGLGHTVAVIAPDYGAEQGAEQVAVDAALPFRVQRVLQHQKLRLNTVLAVLRALRGVQADDIVLACEIRSGLATTVARCLGYRFKKIQMYHGGEIIRAGYGRFGWLSNALAGAFAHKLVGISHYTAGMITQYLKRPSATVLLGVGRDWFTPPTASFDNPQLAALPTDRPWLSTVARVARRKGHLPAIAALQKMQENGALPYYYIIAGKAIDDAYMAELQAAMAATNGQAIYVGQLSSNDVKLLYARSTLFLLAATLERGDVEGFGLVLTEAGAQGCPAVATRVGGIPDALQEGKSGLLCAENDIAGLAQAIRSVLTQPALRAQLGQGAKDYAASLTWERNAQTMLEGL